MKSIRVKIFGSEYPIRGEDENFTKQVAAYVDGMIERIHARVPDQPPLTIAVLTALNIAEELLKYQENEKVLMNNLNNELDKMSRVLEDMVYDADR